MPIWIIAVEWLARGILALLVALSVWSIAIILDRRSLFKVLAPDKFLDEIKESLSQSASHQKKAMFAKKLMEKKMELEHRLSILGTMGSTAPFIGLLGTVLGIIVAFGELSLGSGDSKTIMFALAEALILTAVGLFVAIPAVIAFNIFKKKVQTFSQQVIADGRLLFEELSDF